MTQLAMMATETAMDLNGKRIIVVEDDYLLATEICQELRELGAQVLGPAPTPFYAMHLIGRRKIDAAVLDIRLHGVDVYEVADLLQSRGVPLVFATGSTRDMLPERFHTSSLLSKPIDHGRLARELFDLVRRPAVQPSAAVPIVKPVGQKLAPAHAFARALGRRMATNLARA